MSEISSMLPEGFFDQMNADQITIEVDPKDVPPEEEAKANQQAFQDQYDQIDAEGKEEYGEAFFEGAESSEDMFGGMDSEKASNLATFFADLCSVGKELIGDKYDKSFLTACDREFGEEKRLSLFVLSYADKADGVSLDSIGSCLEDCKKRSPHFKELDFLEVAETGIQYKRLKQKFSSRPIQEYQRDGIERYTRDYLNSLTDFEPSPLILLVMILAITFGADLWRLSKNEIAERKAKKAKK